MLAVILPPLELGESKVKNQLNKFIWTEFGTLSDSIECENFIRIVNENRVEKKISKRAYSGSILKLKEKIKSLMFAQVRVRTSRNTGNWDTNVWFSELEPTCVKHEEHSKLKQTTGTDQECVDSVFASASQDEQEKINQFAESLNAQLSEGMELEAIVNRGHAMRMLALRHGVNHEGRGRIVLLAKSHYRRNLWWVDIPAYGLTNVLVALMFDKQNFYLVTIEPKSPEAYRAAVVEVFGKSESQIKNLSNLSIEALVAVHEKVTKAMNQHLGLH